MRHQVHFEVLILLITSSQIGTDIILNGSEHCGTTESLTRIVVLTDIGFWPWMGSIGYFEKDNWIHQCGATLISNNHILTAAHCSHNSSWSVRFGDPDHSTTLDDRPSATRKFEKTFIHPEYKFDEAYFDVAVIQVDQVPFTDQIRPVCLPGKASEKADLYESDSVTLTGWGNKFKFGSPSPKLLQALLQIYDYDYCNQTHTSFGGDLKAKVDKFLPHLFPLHLICAGGFQGTGSCQGDSGGPLVKFYTKERRYYQVAIVVGGIGECGDANFPGIYIRVDHPKIYNFITEIIHGRTKEPNTPISQIACLTTDNSACHFPFKYGSQTYSECIDIESDVFWCATRVTDDGEIDDWGTCSESCPKLRSNTKLCSVSLSRQQIFVNADQPCPVQTTLSTTGRTTTEPRPTTQSTTRTTVISPNRQRPLSALIEEGETCFYECKESGSCKVRLITTGSVSGGLVQGFCFSESFGGACSGTPQFCQDCKGPCENRAGESFSLPGDHIVKNRQNNEKRKPEFEPSTVVIDDHCLHSCQENGGCSTTIVTKNPISGSVRGSCFPPAFGGSCSEQPEGCRNLCLDICFANPGKSEVRVKLNEFRRPTFVARRSTTSSKDVCVVRCETSGMCSVEIISRDASRTGQLKGSCMPAVFGGHCTGIPVECEPCTEVCQDRLGNALLSLLSKASKEM